MGDVVLSPMTVSPPPSPSSSNRSNLPMLYYGLVVVGTAAIVLTIYNLIITKRCSRGHTHVMQSQPAGPNPNGSVMPSSRSFENSQRNLLSSFKYKREEGEQGGEGGDEHECPVCLSFFEEGEEVRKLPRCKHSFHAECIDMWLYSHFDCPICRTPVGPFRHRFPAENSNSGGVSV